MLTYRRKKTGQTLSLRVEAPLQKIIDRYDSDSPYVLPVLIKAYFTQKCVQYFLECRDMDGRVFEY